MQVRENEKAMLHTACGALKSACVENLLELTKLTILWNDKAVSKKSVEELTLRPAGERFA